MNKNLKLVCAFAIAFVLCFATVYVVWQTLDTDAGTGDEPQWVFSRYVDETCTTDRLRRETRGTEVRYTPIAGTALGHKVPLTTLDATAFNNTTSAFTMLEAAHDTVQFDVDNLNKGQAFVFSIATTQADGRHLQDNILSVAMNNDGQIFAAVSHNTFNNAFDHVTVHGDQIEGLGTVVFSFDFNLDSTIVTITIGDNAPLTLNGIVGAVELRYIWMIQAPAIIEVTNLKVTQVATDKDAVYCARCGHELAGTETAHDSVRLIRNAIAEVITGEVTNLITIFSNMENNPPFGGNRHFPQSLVFYMNNTVLPLFGIMDTTSMYGDVYLSWTTSDSNVAYFTPVAGSPTNNVILNLVGPGQFSITVTFSITYNHNGTDITVTDTHTFGNREVRA